MNRPVEKLQTSSESGIILDRWKLLLRWVLRFFKLKIFNLKKLPQNSINSSVCKTSQTYQHVKSIFGKRISNWNSIDFFHFFFQYRWRVKPNWWKLEDKPCWNNLTAVWFAMLAKLKSNQIQRLCWLLDRDPLEKSIESPAVWNYFKYTKYFSRCISQKRVKSF